MTALGAATAELLARCTFPPPGELYHCAVSGGADSTALAVLATAAGCRPTLWHVDHGLREGSAAEADHVRRLAQWLGAAVELRSVSVTPGPNVEARARQARFGVLPVGVATGHTADDQAETVLLNQLRGSGLSGLGGIRPGARKPILALRRLETRQLCRELSLDVVHDPSNNDLALLRNRVRHQLLPLMAELSGRDPVPLLCRQAGFARESFEFVTSLAKDIDPTDSEALSAAPRPLAVAALRRLLTPLSQGGHPPDAATIDRVLDVAKLRRRATELPGGWRIRRQRKRLILEGTSTLDSGDRDLQR